jgi:hypothetical protein
MEAGDLQGAMENFAVQEIPSDILLAELRSGGYRIAYFSTRAHRYRTTDMPSPGKRLGFGLLGDAIFGRLITWAPPALWWRKKAEGPRALPLLIKNI